MAHNPCEGDLTATLIDSRGRASIQKAAPAKNPPIDCFYVYPTASTQTTPNAALIIDPGIVATARQQAARFSQVCRVYAPVYRQLTLTGLSETGIVGSKPPPGTPQPNSVEPYQDVVSAWADYLAHDNHGRGIVLIGHSQGSFLLIQLIRQQIDDNSTVRARLVSAILPGGNVQASSAPNSTSGDTFVHIPPCRSSGQTGCVVAYSSFTEIPPPGSLFGYINGPTSGPGSGGGLSARQVQCTNPAALTGRTRQLDPYFPTDQNQLVGGSNQPKVTTPWVAYPDLFQAGCMSQGGASWLQIDDIRGKGDTRPSLTEVLGPAWGLHLLDINLALGNLVELVQRQARAYAHRPSLGTTP